MPPQLAYVNSAILACRMKGAYKKLLRNDVAGAVRLINNTLNLIRFSTPLEDISVLNEAMDMMYKILIHIAMKRYNTAYDYIRRMYFMYASTLKTRTSFNGVVIYPWDDEQAIIRHW